MIQHWTGFVTRKCFSVKSHTQLRLIYFRNGSVLRQVFSWLLRGILASSFKSCGQLSDVRCEVGVVCFVGICLVCGAVRCCTSPAELFLATPSCVVARPALYCAQWGFPSPAGARGYLVQGAHGGGGGGDHVVHEEEEGVLRPQADPLADEEVELADGEIRGNQVLLLVQVADPGLG